MESVWLKDNEQPNYPAAQGKLQTQVLVIGGGMAGILCARQLQQAGVQVMVAEARKIGGGVTGRTTAVLTAQHDILYQDLIRSRGTQAAKAYLQANLDAVEAFRQAARDMDCDFEDRPSIQFTARDPERLRREAEAVNSLGFPAAFSESVPMPVPVSGAVTYPGMAQFHPMKFLKAAAKGLTVFENSRVLRLDGTTVYTDQAEIRARQVIVATHFPFINRRGLYFMKLYQSRSYVLALENAPDPGATLAELDGEGMYFRRWGDLLIVGGGDHRTGKKGGGFPVVRAIARKYFPRAKEKFAWANQDCMSLDGLPYVGRYSPNMPGVYVATGFNAWGMTNSMAAAKLLTDQILGRENPLAQVLRPDRSVMHKQLLCNLGATVADFAIPTGKRCPHLGCALRWNPQEHSWDCPCHGSRFTENGGLLDSPAQKDANI